MNKFLITMAVFCLAVFSVSAVSQTFARMENNAGGYIYLTDIDCQGGYDGSHIIFTRNSQGDTTVGCWAYMKDTGLVVVRWEDNGMSTYPMNHFQPIRKR